MPALAPLTGQNMIDRFSDIVNDSFESTDQALFAINQIKDEVEAGWDWYFLRSVDTTQSVNAGDTYTSMKTLPADFLVPRTVFLQNDISPLIQISLEDSYRFKDIYKRYYIDYKNNQYAICGSNSGPKSIIMNYGASSPAITLTSAPTWPVSFHSYFPRKMAEIWGSGEDADDINLRISRENLRQATSILKAMRTWDARLKVAEYNAKNMRHSDLSGYPNVVGENY